MKKTLLSILLLILTICIAMAFVGCNNSQDSDHVWKEEYSYDNTFHWIECTHCDEQKGKAEHTADSSGVCSVCGAVVNEEGDSSEAEGDSSGTEGDSSEAEGDSSGTEGILYNLSSDDTYAMVIGYSGEEKEVLIAGEYQDKPVKMISDEAFKGSNITSVNIPSSITTIGTGAFANCTSLADVKIGNNVTTVGVEAFYGCTSLISIKIPNNVTTVGYMAFCNCTSLTIYCEAEREPYAWSYGWNFTSCPIVWDCNNNNVATDECIYAVINGVRYGLKDGEATVARQATNIVIANIPSSITYKDNNYNVTSIVNCAFYRCASLTTVTIGNNIASILDETFYQCFSLSSVTIGNNVTSIGVNVFLECTSLTSIEIPSNITNIGDYAFNGCTALTIYCEIASAPSSWGVYWKYFCPVVWDCNNNDVATDEYIYTVIDDIRYGIKDGEASVVRQASNKITATIPDYITYKDNSYDVTSLGDSAFSNCTLLTSVIIGGNVSKIAWTAFSYCSSLVSIEIPDNVTNLGSYIFSKCTALTSITIGGGVTSIGDYAFEDCTALNEINFNGTIEKWNSVSKGIFWYNNVPTYLVHCTDGDVSI